MKYLVTGVSGQLGYDICRELKMNPNNVVLGLNHQDLDITDEASVFEKIIGFNPDVIFHCAAYTNVDKAEDDRKTAYSVNVLGTRYIRQVAEAINAKLFYISTDYVFDGKKDGIYIEEDKTSPMNVYGETKRGGELEVLDYEKAFIVRISWVFGINGKNFVKTMLRLGETKREISVVDDQIGSPTYTVDLAKLLVDMALTDKYGIYHATNENFCSWAEFAEYIFEVNGIDTKVNKVSTEEYLEITGIKQAYRPRNSRLSKDRLKVNGFEELPTWQDAVFRFSRSLKK